MGSAGFTASIASAGFVVAAAWTSLVRLVNLVGSLGSPVPMGVASSLGPMSLIRSVGLARCISSVSLSLLTVYCLLCSCGYRSLPS